MKIRLNICFRIKIRMAVHLGKCQMKLFAAFNRLVGINFSNWSKSEKPLGW